MIRLDGDYGGLLSLFGQKQLPSLALYPAPISVLGGKFRAPYCCGALPKDAISSKKRRQDNVRAAVTGKHC